jgi:thioredoxin-like negative regulator of GroEL
MKLRDWCGRWLRQRRVDVSYACLAVIACSPAATQSPVPSVALTPNAPTNRSAGTSSVTPMPPLTQSQGPLVLLRDEPGAALQEAKKRDLPIVVVLSASWCHTCKHMEHTTLTDPALAAARDSAVWLDVDVDVPANEAFLREHSYQALPTVLLLSASGVERARWVGGLDAAELLQFVRRGSTGSPLVAQVTEASLRRAWTEVVERVANAPIEPERSLWERIALATAAVDACAALVPAPAPAPLSESFSVRRRCESYPPLLRGLLQDAQTRPPEEQFRRADDISSGFEALAELPETKDWVATEWAPFLEKQVQYAPNAKSAFDAHRVLAYLQRKTPGDAISMLLASAQAAPSDFNPHARLARVYREMGRYQEAITSIREALKRVTGPRTLRVLDEEARICEKLGDLEGARRALAAIVNFAGWLPGSGAAQKARAKEQLERLASASAPGK